MVNPDVSGIYELLESHPLNSVEGANYRRIYGQNSPVLSYIPGDAYLSALKENWEVTLLVSKIC